VVSIREADPTRCGWATLIGIGAIPSVDGWRAWSRFESAARLLFVGAWSMVRERDRLWFIRARINNSFVLLLFRREPAHHEIIGKLGEMLASKQAAPRSIIVQIAADNGQMLTLTAVRR
jgi:hypothetical protein